MPYDKNYLLAGAGKKKMPTISASGGLTAAPKRTNMNPDPFELQGSGVGTATTFGDGGTTSNTYHYGDYGGTGKGKDKFKFGGGGGGGQGGFSGRLRNLRNTDVIAQIEEIIARQGKTDPARMNLLLSDVSRGTEADRSRLAGDASLVGGSGVLAALDAAIGAGGTETRARVIADENAKAEERQRQDILNLVLGPLERRAGRKAQLKAALEAARARGGGSFDVGGLLGVLGPLLKNLNMGGGNGTDSGLGEDETPYGTGGPESNFGSTLY